MKMDAGLDTGPILSQCAIQLNPQDTAGFISETLSKIGAELLIKTIPGYLSGEILPQPQPEQGATYAPMLKKEDGRLDFSEPAEILTRRVYACNPWPGAFMDFKSGRLKIHRAHAVGVTSLEKVPGTRINHSGEPGVITSDGLLVLDEVQVSGKKPIAGRSFLTGGHDWEGS